MRGNGRIIRFAGRFREPLWNMKNKPVSSDWNTFARESASLRRRLESLFNSAVDGAKSPEVEVIGCVHTLEAELEAWKAVVKSSVDKVSPVLETLTPRRAKELEAFADRLRRALTENGLEVYGESGLLIVNGHVHVDLKPDAGMVLINGAQNRSLDRQHIVTAVREEAERRASSLMPPKEFLQILLRSYRLVCSDRGLHTGSQVAVLELLPYVLLNRQRPRFLLDPQSGGFVEYPLSAFRADLYNLLVSQVSLVDRVQFRYASGSDTKGAVFMLVPALSRTAYVGRAWFDAEGE
jgi:hypothetical protein